MSTIQHIIRRHKEGQAVGIYSVCSSHLLVLKATLARARRDGTPALIEATSNQVNQFGGYTGMQPVDFRQMVVDLAARMGLEEDHLILGGDHLGPNCWRASDADTAMRNSEVLIAQYVEAGFRKIHLDCSMSCEGDSVPLPDEEIAERAARLCAIAERSWERAGGEAPVYVIGTEVPAPGGALEELQELEVTSPEAALATLRIHKEAFERRRLGSAWDRMIGLVVQPGVEFDHDKVIDYRRPAAVSLSRAIESENHIVFEAHSTDYQRAINLGHLVQDHFAILKVGPALTYALREAFWALDLIDVEINGSARAANLRDVVLDAMNQDPTHWEGYYQDEDPGRRLQMQYSLSDRIRYYWPLEKVSVAAGQLVQNLGSGPIPQTLLKQYLPNQYAAIRGGDLQNDPEELIIHKIDEVLSQYAQACSLHGSTRQ